MHQYSLKKAGTFAPLAAISTIQSFLPYAPKQTTVNQPQRKSLEAPIDNNTFVKPIKQCFVKNPRLMPMTRLMLTLVSGWAGQGGSISTTIGIIAKHLSRSRRQVFRYLKDAMEEGYLSYNKTKGQFGLYTGIKIWLNFDAIRFTRFQKKSHKRKTQKSSKSRINPEVTFMADTNTKHFYNRIEKEEGVQNTNQDDELWKRLLSFGKGLGYLEKQSPSVTDIPKSNLMQITC